MSRYPFKDKAVEYMEAKRGCIAQTSWDVQDRRYRRIERDLIALNKQGLVSSVSPMKMTPDDVKAFIVSRKEAGIGSSDINHDITALSQLLTFSGNSAVGICLAKNPGLKPSKRQERLDPLAKTTYERILEKWGEVDHNSYFAVRPFAMVLMYIGTGARNKELRLADVSDIDTQAWQIRLRHVKGEGSYGHPRDVPIPQELIPVVRNYLDVRLAWLISHKASSDALFFATGNQYGYMSGNSVRRLKTKVEEQIGEKFELRDCRRAFGQFYLDKGLAISKVSVLMGHDTTKTTEEYYCRNSEREAIKEASSLW